MVNSEIFCARFSHQHLSKHDGWWPGDHQGGLRSRLAKHATGSRTHMTETQAHTKAYDADTRSDPPRILYLPTYPLYKLDHWH